MNKKHIGSTLESLFEETGELEEVLLLAQKKLIADKIAEAMKVSDVTVSEMSRRMHTSRAAVNRILDPEESGLTLDSLHRAVSVIGYKLDVNIVPADRVPARPAKLRKKSADKTAKRLARG